MELPRPSKRICLFTILVFLCFTITINLILTVWIITSVRLNFNGINIVRTMFHVTFSRIGSSLHCD